MPGNRERTESVLLAQQLRQTQTPAEAQMWQLLRNRRFCGLKFRRQAHIAGFIADFACFERQLVVEGDSPRKPPTTRHQPNLLSQTTHFAPQHRPRDAVISG